ncbi:MAG: glycosyltransferase involved in cell wall biosynthesis [Pseudoalteromonas distincta]|jgi:glycosyltransferase involved in cell wall biosynthesis
MKILILHNAYQMRGGEDSVVEAEVALLQRAGYDVRLERVSNDGISGSVASAEAFMKAPYDPARARWIRDIVKRDGIALVHVHNAFPRLTPAVHIGASAGGAAVVQTLHNYRLVCANALMLRDGKVCELCLDGHSWPALKHRCYRGSLPGTLAVVRMQRRMRARLWRDSVDQFVALTGFAAGKFTDSGLPADRISVKPNFRAPAPTSSASRQGFLFVGRLSPEKGVDVLLDAWRRLPDLHLTIVGDGPDAAALRERAPGNVTFTGPLSPDDVQMHMLRAVALVMPSVWYEGFPMTIVEAYASGLPVIASRLGSLAEIVRHGETGLLFEPGSAELLATALREADQLELARMGTTSLEEYQMLYTPERNLEMLLDIYGRALARRRACP